MQKPIEAFMPSHRMPCPFCVEEGCPHTKVSAERLLTPRERDTWLICRCHRCDYNGYWLWKPFARTRRRCTLHMHHDVPPTVDNIGLYWREACVPCWLRYHEALCGCPVWEEAQVEWVARQLERTGT